MSQQQTLETLLHSCIGAVHEALGHVHCDQAPQWTAKATDLTEALQTSDHQVVCAQLRAQLRTCFKDEDLLLPNLTSANLLGTRAGKVPCSVESGEGLCRRDWRLTCHCLLCLPTSWRAG